MKRARGWAAACFAASAVVATWPGTADADAPQAAAYWMRSNPAAAAPAAAPNPAVPNGGLFVDNDPSTEAPTATPAANQTQPTAFIPSGQKRNDHYLVAVGEVWRNGNFG